MAVPVRDARSRPPARVAGRTQGLFGGSLDLAEDFFLQVGGHDGQDNLLFGFDLDAEYPLLFVAPDAASEKDGPAVRARIHGRLQHRIAPSLAHNGYD